MQLYLIAAFIALRCTDEKESERVISFNASIKTKKKKCEKQSKIQVTKKKKKTKVKTKLVLNERNATEHSQ